MGSAIPDRLQEILSWKRKEIDEVKNLRPLTDVIEKAFEISKTKRHSPFKKALAESENGIKIIAEIKRASPSRGIIKADFDVVSQAIIYESAGASAISVLTEKKFFHGSLDDLRNVKESVGIAVLRKDFIIDEYQIYESVLAGADAVLLIARILSKEKLTDFLGLSKSLGLDALVETHDEADMEKALMAGSSIVGINNRDLSTFTISLETTLRLARFLDPERHIGVSESGIQGREDVERIVSLSGIKCFLVGELLMRSPDPAREIRSLKGNVQ